MEQGRTLFVTVSCNRRGANGSEPRPVRQFRITHPLHSDDEPLFGPQNSPKLTVSVGLSYSVEFKVRRRAPGEVPYSIKLDHGDTLVMDGLAQSEYENRTVSGLQGPRVNLTFRWITQHIASCPPAGAVCWPSRVHQRREQEKQIGQFFG